MKTVELMVRFNCQVPDNTRTEGLVLETPLGAAFLLDDKNHYQVVPAKFVEYETMSVQELS